MDTDELVNTMNTLLSHRDTIRKLKNDKIFLQCGNYFTQITKESLCKLPQTENLLNILKQFQSLKHNEYMLVAYHNENVLGTKLKL